jgi:hypothetical protein
VLIMNSTSNDPQAGRPTSRPSDFRDQARAAVDVVLAVADCVRALGTVPSGHLYARLMGSLGIDTYQSVIATLVRAGLVREHPSHLLEWIGPSGPTIEGTQTNNRKELQS